MAKAKKPSNKEKESENENTCGVQKKGNKFFCVACGSVVDINHDKCPECGNEVNWGRAIIETYRGNQFP